MALTRQQYTIFSCEWCGSSIIQDVSQRQVRKDKKFCCASHRKAFNRWLHGVHKQSSIARKAMSELAEYAKHDRARSMAIDELIFCKQFIEAALKYANVTSIKVD